MKMQSKDITGEKGASMVEYALLVALIAIICIGAIRGFGIQVGRKFNVVTDGVDGIVTEGAGGGTDDPHGEPPG